MRHILSWVLAWALLTPLSPLAADQAYLQRFVTQGDYANVREDLVLAITGQGLVVNNVAHVGDMLQRTAADLGATQRIYDQAEVFEFCSARLSRDMMAEDPDQIVLCPYTIAIYSLPQRPGEVVLAYRRPWADSEPQAGSPLARADALLERIIREVIEF